MNIDACINQAISLQNDGEFIAAIDNLERALEFSRENMQILHFLAASCNNHGSYLLQKGDHSGALNYYHKAISYRTDLPDLFYNLGNLHKEQGDNDQAIEQYLNVLKLDPGHYKALSNLAHTYKSTGKLADVEKCYNQALQYNPDAVETYNNLGLLYYEQQFYEAALDCFQHAINVDPGFRNGRVNKAITLSKLYRFGASVCAYRLLLQDYPDDLALRCALASVYNQQGRDDLACEIYSKILNESSVTRKDLNPKIVANLLMNLLYSSSIPPSRIYLQHKILADEYFSYLRPSPIRIENIDKPLLRIGYVSANFCRHSVSYFFEPILDSYDRNRFHITCYSNNKQDDEVTLRLKQKADHWVDIGNLSDEAATKLINLDQIDILVDLAGHTKGHRLGVFARKPAPVQVTYLGYPATTGLTAIDYRISDGYADPVGLTEAMHTETLVRLSQSIWCYKPADAALDVASSFIKRGYVTFGTFNELAKINSDVVAVWSKILNGVAGSRLIMKNKALSDEETRRYLLYLFEKNGIHKDRIDCVGNLESYRDHMLLYNDIDIALDPFPYNGTTTTFEALWMGVPVITLEGVSHVSRVGVSILSNLGLPELIAKDPSDYVEKAIQLASDYNYLDKLKMSLRAKMLDSCLVDSVNFVRDLEKAYAWMWNDRCSRF